MKRFRTLPKISKQRLQAWLMVASFLFLPIAQPANVWAAAGDPEAPSSDAAIHSIVTGTTWYDPNAGVCAIVNGQQIDLNATQEANANIVIGIAKTLNLGQRGALIGLMTGLTESSLTNEANDGSYKDSDEDYSGTRLKELSEAQPHDAVGNDHDSVGIMQQRVTGGWAGLGSSYSNLGNPEVYARLMNPAFASAAFYKALMGVTNWQGLDPGAAAQAVQGSAYPTRYNDHRAAAQSLMDKFWETAQAVPLPPGFTGDAAAGAATNGCIGGSRAAILNKIHEFAWPDYRAAGSSNAMDKVPAYQAAVDRAPYKGDCDGVDCGAFVTIVMRESGADPEYDSGPYGPGNTTVQIDYLRRMAATGKYTRVMSKDALQPGDIAIKSHPDWSPPEGHTFFYVGSAISQMDPNWHGDGASASQCERAPMASGVDTFEDYEWYHLN